MGLVGFVVHLNACIALLADLAGASNGRFGHLHCHPTGGGKCLTAGYALLLEFTVNAQAIIDTVVVIVYGPVFLHSFWLAISRALGGRLRQT